MPTYRITAVRTAVQDEHRHITRVRLNGATTGDGYSREVIVADLRDPNGDRYYTSGGGEYADVVIRGCPYCSRHDYITTLPDSTVKNNLLDLPRF